MKKNIAFTLAEVLITLGVIGVVAALTIPELMTAYKAHQLRSQFLKSYSVIQQAFKQMEADDVSLDPLTYPSAKFYKTFSNYVKVAIDCGTYLTQGSNPHSVCFNYKYVDGALTHGGTYKTLNGTGFEENVLDDGQIVLMDGANLMFENPGPNRIFVSVDLNGFKSPPNRAGYDLFTFQFIDGELRTMGSKGTIYSDIDKYCNIKANDHYNGIACAHRAKTESDYFKWVIKNVK